MSEAKLKQQEIDIKNLRFYAEMAHEFKWETDIIHWSVIKHTLREIAERLAAAPDLYAALKNAQEELRLIRMKDCDRVYDTTLRTRIAAALAKATGHE